jgi:hypothetical protein
MEFVRRKQKPCRRSPVSVAPVGGTASSFSVAMQGGCGAVISAQG